MEEFNLRDSIQSSIFAFGDYISDTQTINNISLLKSGIQQMLTLNIDNEKDAIKVAYYMVLAEAHRNCITISPKGFVNFENDDVIMHIQYLRMALHYSSQHKDLENIQLINLGNALNNVKRHSEAIRCWKRVLINRHYSSESIISTVLSNLGTCEYDIVPFLSAKELMLDCFKIARCHLSEALGCSSTQKDQKAKVRYFLQQIQNEEIYVFNHRNRVLEQICERNDNSKEFITWCLSNTLFLNPFNDVTDTDRAAYDTISKSFESLEIDPYIVSCFQELTTQFTYSRQILYETYEQKDDNKNKDSYRIAYSIFDKLAGLIDIYFDLGLNRAILSYNKIWFTKNGKKNIVNEKLLSTDNPYLIALYWISRDLFLEGQPSSDPEAMDIAKCRNYIEHRFVNIVEQDVFREQHNNSQLQIGRNVLYQKNLKLHVLVRSALIYFYCAVFEECYKNKYAE